MLFVVVVVVAVLLLELTPFASFLLFKNRLLLFAAAIFLPNLSNDDMVKLGFR